MKITADGNHAVIDDAERAAVMAGPAPDPDKPALPSQIEDDEKRLAVARKLLASEKGRVAIRGFEVARLNPNGDWEQVAKGKLPFMVATAKWLNERHPNSLYQARVIVSAEIPDRPVTVPQDALTTLAENMGVETVEGPPDAGLAGIDRTSAPEGTSWSDSLKSTPTDASPVEQEEAPTVNWDLGGEQ